MPDNYITALLSLLAGGSRGYFMRKQEQSEEQQRLKMAQISMQNRLNEKQVDFYADIFKETGDEHIGRDILKLDDQTIAAVKNRIKMEATMKSAGKTQEGKPQAGTMLKSMFEEGKNMETGVTPIKGVPGAGINVAYSPEERQQTGVQRLAQLEQQTGNLDPVARDMYLKQMGIQPPEKEVSEKADPILTRQLSNVALAVSDLDDEINELEKPKFDPRNPRKQIQLDYLNKRKLEALKSHRKNLRLFQRELANRDIRFPEKIFNDKLTMPEPEPSTQLTKGEVVKNALTPNAGIGGKTIVKMGTDKATGRKVIQYDDGTIEYAD